MAKAQQKQKKTLPSGEPANHDHWLPILLGAGVLVFVVGGIANYSYPGAPILTILLHVLLGVLWVVWIGGFLACFLNIIRNFVIGSGRGFLWIIITILYGVIVIGGGIQLLDALTAR